MKLYYIGILQNQDKPAVEICSAHNRAAYPGRIKEPTVQLMTMISKTVAERTRPGQRQDIEEMNNTLHVYARPEGIAGVIVSDHEYPGLVAHKLLSDILENYITRGLPKDKQQAELEKALSEYQDPKKVDSIANIQKELDETKIVLHKTIQNVLERGEKLDTLVAKSDELSLQSKFFYTSSKRMNSCCTVM